MDKDRRREINRRMKMERSGQREGKREEVGNVPAL